MKKLLKADLYSIFVSKMLVILLISAVLVGFFLPALFFGIFKFVGNLGNLMGDIEVEELKPLLESMDSVFDMLNARSVFMMTAPLAEGFGIIAMACAAYTTANQFSSGIIRNKIIANKKRPQIVISIMISTVLFTIMIMFINYVSTALAARLFFGKFDLDFKGFAYIFAVCLMIVIAYTAINVTIAFFAKSVPLSIIMSILLIIATGTIFSLLVTFMSKAPKSILNILTVFPTFQSSLLMNENQPVSFLVLSIVFDLAWLVIMTLISCLKFKKSDLK